MINSNNKVHLAVMLNNAKCLIIMHVSLVSESPSEKKAKFKNSYKIFIKPESVCHLGCESR